MRAAVAESARLLLLVDKRPIADFRVREILVPLQEVCDRGQQAAIAVNLLERHVRMEAILFLVVRDRAAFDDPCVIVAP